MAAETDGVQQFKLPDVGEGLTEAEIVKWHVKPGDSVSDGQHIVDIETAKSVVELPCPFHGTVTELIAGEGSTVEVGEPIITVNIGGGTVAAEPEPVTEEPAPAAPAEEPVKREPVLVGYGVKPSSTKRRARKATPAAPAQGRPAPQAEPLAPAPATQPAPAPARSVTVLAKPPVRKLAKDLGVDLTAITGTGPNGTISREDVHGATTGRSTAPTGASGPVSAEERIDIRGVRKYTAAAMVQSAFTAPHVTELLQVDVTETMELVRRLRALPDFADVKVSPLLLVAKALLVAARRYPMINACWEEDAGQIVVKHYVNLGIAAATERGLIVPNVKDAHAASLPELARSIADLTELARSGKAQPADQAGGTITITNIGVFGVDAGTPIINPGEAAILAFGQVRDMPWVHDGELAIRKVTTLALSFDHRIVDGELGSKALRDIGAMLHDPAAMLAWS